MGLGHPLHAYGLKLLICRRKYDGGRVQTIRPPQNLIGGVTSGVACKMVIPHWALHRPKWEDSAARVVSYLWAMTPRIRLPVAD